MTSYLATQRQPPFISTEMIKLEDYNKLAKARWHHLGHTLSVALQMKRSLSITKSTLHLRDSMSKWIVWIQNDFVTRKVRSWILVSGILTINVHVKPETKQMAKPYNRC